MSAQAAGRGVKRAARRGVKTRPAVKTTRNSAGLAALAESVVRDFLRTPFAIAALLVAFPLVAQDPFVARMNHFAATYRQFADQHNRGLFDVRLARELSREWHDIEASGEWPRGDGR